MEEDSACVYVFFCLHVQRTHVQAHANLSAIADMQTSMHAYTYAVCVAVCACAFARVRVWPINPTYSIYHSMYYSICYTELLFSRTHTILRYTIV